MAKLSVIGAGIMGQYSARALEGKFDEVFVYDPNKSPFELGESFKGLPFKFCGDLKTAVEQSDFVLYCVPSEKVEGTMAKSLPFCKTGAIISGQTSRKTPEKQAFDKYNLQNPGRLEMVTIHTMCNPSASIPKNEILAIIPNGCSEAAYRKAVEFYGGMSTHVEHFKSVEEHDNVLANTQVNTSRTNLSIASAFASAGSFPWVNGSYGSGLDVMKFALAMRSASLPAHVYRGIQFGNEHGRNLVALSANVGSALRIMIKDQSMHNDLEKEILDTRKKLFGDEKRTILRDEDVNQFGKGKSLPNSQIALILYAMDDAQKGRNPFDYLKGTTPMHTSLLCLTDYLFKREGLLEASVDAIRKQITLRDDSVFFDEWLAWEEAIRLQNPEQYDSQHGKMSERLRRIVPSKNMKEYLDLSKTIVGVCRQRMTEAAKLGIISC